MKAMLCAYVLSVWLALASFGSAAPHKEASLHKRAYAPPTSDPFYTPPAGFAKTALGTVLKSRTVTVSFSGDPINVLAYQLLYRTNSVNGTALATVTTVFKPANAIPNQLVSFASAEDSAFINCAPSYDYVAGTSSTNSIVTYETLLLEGFLNKGYIVTSSDYEGPSSAFGAARQSGQGVLDAIRATLNFAPLGFNKATAKVAQYGYSGGAIASGWAAALHPTYAKEINLVGVATGGTPTNVSGTLTYIDGGLFAGFGVGGITGLLAAYSSLDTLFATIATAKAKAAITTAQNQCATSDIQSFAFQKIQTYDYTTAGPNLLYLPQVVAITSKNILGAFKNETPTAPLYMFHSVADEIIPIANADTTVSKYCANKIPSLTYQRLIGGVEHASGEILGYPAALSWISDRLSGVPATPGCTIQTTAVSLFDKGALGAALETVLGDLLNILGADVGMQDEILKANIQKAVAK